MKFRNIAVFLLVVATLRAGAIVSENFVNTVEPTICRTIPSHFKPTRLRVEHLDTPVVIDLPKPRFSWINIPYNDSIKSASQSSYRIVVSSSPEKLNTGCFDVWDSGRVLSSQSYLIEFNGKELKDGRDYFWKVMVWDENGVSSGWSAPSKWSVGFIDENRWKAKWIGAPWQSEEPFIRINQETANGGFPAPLLRKNFVLMHPPIKAKAYVSSMGYFELRINGQKISNDVLVPNFTNYTYRNDIEQYGISIDNDFSGYRTMYLVYDITDRLSVGENVVGAILGNGFADTNYPGASPYGSPRFLCQIELEYANGDTQTIISDNTWNAIESPIAINGPFAGEVYDASQEKYGWDSPGYDASDWNSVSLRNAPIGQLCAHMAPTDKVCESFRPISVTKLAEKEWKVTFPVEISGWIRFDSVKVEKNDTVEIKYISESPQGINRYISGNTHYMDYSPRFTWFVFSDAIISGVDSLTNENIIAEAVYTDVKDITRFHSSNPLLDSIIRIWKRSQLDNMHGGIASDCPHRERAPYTGDGQVAMNMVMSNFDAAAFYRKWIRDMRDTQNPSTGYVPNSAPWQPGCGGGVAWGAAMNIMPWEFYKYYGDPKILEENYEAMKAQADYMSTWITEEGTMFAQRRNTNDRDGSPNYWLNLGEWIAPYELPGEELVHTFYLWRCLDYTSKAASVLGFEHESELYRERAEKVAAAFHKKFYNEEEKSYGDYGANVFALEIGLSQERKKSVVETLRKEIAETHDGHLNTGIFASRYLFDVLGAVGLNDLAYTILTKTDYPSFGLWLKQGATTTWEQWDGGNSHNHPMFGGGLIWFYTTLAGLKIDESAPGYRQFTVRPNLPIGLDNVDFSTMTPYGPIRIIINRMPDTLSLVVSVPIGSQADVYIPVDDPSKKVYLDGINEPLTGHAEMDNTFVVKVGQGTYHYVVR